MGAEWYGNNIYIFSINCIFNIKNCKFGLLGYTLKVLDML